MTITMMMMMTTTAPPTTLLLNYYDFDDDDDDDDDGSTSAITSDTRLRRGEAGGAGCEGSLRDGAANETTGTDVIMFFNIKK